MMKKEDGKQRLTGAILVLIGMITLAAQLIEVEWLGLSILPALGLIFLTWGVLTREAGPIIPGGILSGIGAGILLLEVLGLEEPVSGGVFMFAFAGGWLLIPLLTAIFTRETQWWALIPASIMALIGAAALDFQFAETVFGGLARLWPVALIVAGLLIIIRQGKKAA